MTRLLTLAVIFVVLEMTVYSAFSEGVVEQTTTNAYTLIRMPEGQEMIQSQEGGPFPIVTPGMRGNVARVVVENNVAVFHGWSADVENALFPDAVLVFVNGRFFYAGQTSTDQKWLVERTGNASLLKSGFAYKFPLEEFEDFDNSEIGFFAFWKNGGARELNYYEQGGQEQYKWKKKNHPVARVSEDKQGEFLPYSLISVSEGSDVIRTPEGKKLPVRAVPMIARLGLPQIKKNLIEFQGWAAHVESGEPPKAILMFVNGKLFHTGKTGHMTPWLLEKYESPALAEAGFHFTFPLQAFNDLENSEIRVFSLWENGTVLEMEYPKDYQWAKKQSVAVRRV